MSAAVAAPGRGAAFDVALVLVLNALPVWGVLAGEWSIGALMVLFWLENLIAGGLHALRMAALPGPPVLHGMKFVLLPFFVVHYGLFTFGHAMFVFAQFVEDGDRPWAQPGFLAAAAVALGVQAWQAWQAHHAHVPAVHAPDQLAAAHKDPKVAREQVLPLARMMMEPYVRVGILHVVIVIGGMLSMLLGAPLVALLLLIGLKAAYEVAQARGITAAMIMKLR